MTVRDIIQILEAKFPLNNAEEWDNSGLLVGDREASVSKILFALDVIDDVIDLAIKSRADMIISHHPMIFGSIKNVTSDTILGAKIIKAIQHNICIYAIHTNLDASHEGLNEYLLKTLNIHKFDILDTNPTIYNVGIGRCYDLDTPTSIADYAKLLKSKLEIPDVRIYAKDINRKIQHVSLVNGAGMSYWSEALAHGSDIIVTGDVRHHDALDAVEAGIDVMDISHYHGEKIFTEILIPLLQPYNLPYEIYQNNNIFVTI